MRTVASRRDDGKFGVEPVTPSVTSDGKFKKGEPRPPKAGRRAGTPNKLKAAMEELKALPGIPQDSLEFLLYIQLNPDNLPYISWDLRTRAASERARYMYARKTDAKIDIGPKSEEIARLLIAGRVRVAKMERTAVPEKPEAPSEAKPKRDLSTLSDEELERMLEEKRRQRNG